MKSVTQEFLSVHWDRKSPLLLGYSGGPDSKALLYSLLECGVKPQIAHVDHGWRSESSEEALLLEQEAERLGLEYRCIKLDIARKEDDARKARFQYFSSIYSNHQALMLAHTKDDLAETVLKRLFEGANLFRLGGMQSVSSQFGMTLWRPFLTLEKKELIEFLKERELPFFQDPCNFDLRSRMRAEIFPYLEKLFGKAIKDNLILFSERSFELREFLDSRDLDRRIIRGPWGTLIDLNGLHPFEMRYLLQKLISSRKIIKTLLEWVETPTKTRRLSLQKQEIFVSQGRVWLSLNDSK